jgi:hypothetical protein
MALDLDEAIFHATHLTMSRLNGALAMITVFLFRHFGIAIASRERSTVAFRENSPGPAPFNCSSFWRT